MCRLAGGDPALTDLVRRRDELAVWLEQAENAVSSLPVTATDKNLKELKVQRSSKHTQVDAIHRSAETFISAPELGRFGYFFTVSSDCVTFSFVLCLLHCTNKLLSASQSQEKKLSNLQTKTEITLTSLVLNGTFLLKEVQLLCVPVNASFLFSYFALICECITKSISIESRVSAYFPCRPLPRKWMHRMNISDG